MEKKSYFRVDEVPEISVENLRPASINGRKYELQSKLWDKIYNFIRKRNSGAAQDCIS